MKHILVISQHAPYTAQTLRESLDMVLIFAAIDQTVTWLVEGDAVLALKKSQQPKLLQSKDFTKAIKMLALYDVDTIYACERSIADHGLVMGELFDSAHAVSAEQKQALIAQADEVITL